MDIDIHIFDVYYWLRYIYKSSIHIFLVLPPYPRQVPEAPLGPQWKLTCEARRRIRRMRTSAKHQGFPLGKKHGKAGIWRVEIVREFEFIMGFSGRRMKNMWENSRTSRKTKCVGTGLGMFKVIWKASTAERGSSRSPPGPVPFFFCTYGNTNLHNP